MLITSRDWYMLFFFFTYDLHSIRLQSSIVGQWCVSYSHGDLALLMKLCFSSFLNSFLLSLAIYFFFSYHIGRSISTLKKSCMRTEILCLIHSCTSWNSAFNIVNTNNGNNSNDWIKEQMDAICRSFYTTQMLSEKSICANVHVLFPFEDLKVNGLHSTCLWPL